MLTSADTGCILWSYISLPVSNEVNMLTSIDTGCILWSYISLPVSNEVNMLTPADTGCILRQVHVVYSMCSD